MKNTSILLYFLLTIVGCETKEFRSTEFYIKNYCGFTIEIHSSAIVRYSTGPKEESLVDFISASQILLSRQIKVAAGFNIKEVFTKMEVFNDNGIKSNINVLTNDKWVKGTSTTGNDSYTLTVDQNFF
jgi:hypothetical protein